MQAAVRQRPAQLPENARVIVVAGEATSAALVQRTGQLLWYEAIPGVTRAGNLRMLATWAAQRAAAADTWYVVLLPEQNG